MTSMGDGAQTEELGKFPDIESSILADDAAPPGEASRLTPNPHHNCSQISDITNGSAPQHTEEPIAIDINHCCAIIQALEEPSFELRTFENVTPEEYDFIVLERSDFRFPKLFYDVELFRLTAMVPTPIHQHSINFLTESIRKLLAPYDTGGVQVSYLFNSAIEGKDGKCVVPDIRLDLTPGYTTYGEEVTTWIGEIGSGQTRTDMEQKLARAIEKAPTIDAAFMVTIHEAESDPPQDPENVLVSQPLTGADFTGPLIRPVTILSPIVVQDVQWAAIDAVNLFVFLRGEDGKFNFNINDENPNAARGVLHPKISMEQVVTLLNVASRRLVTTIADMMECHHDNNLTSIRLLRDASKTVTFPINWNSFLYNIQHALFFTARGRYKRWLDRQLSKQISVEPGPSNKRKQPSNSAGSRKKRPRQRR